MKDDDKTTMASSITERFIRHNLQQYRHHALTEYNNDSRAAAKHGGVLVDKETLLANLDRLEVFVIGLECGPSLSVEQAPRAQPSDYVESKIAMSEKKKKTRAEFREAVFSRDGHQCRVCSWKQDPEQLDSHHIIDRRRIPNGGYVLENGITLCPECHVKAEQFHSTGLVCTGYAMEDLFRLIGSSPEKAMEAAKKLSR